MSYDSEGIWCLVTSSHQTKKTKLFLIPLHSSTGNCMMYAGVMHFRFVLCHYLHLRILSVVISNNIKTSAPLSTAKCVCARVRVLMAGVLLRAVARLLLMIILVKVATTLNVALLSLWRTRCRPRRVVPFFAISHSHISY